MPLRNPFKRTTGGIESQDDSRQGPRSSSDGGFLKTTVVGSKPVDIKEPAEYKLCEINDSGVYLPPSPPEKKGFWRNRSNASTTSSNHRSVLSDNEPFGISRESFESYRRSFDISARSPVSDLDLRPRQSLDSRRAAMPRSSFDIRRIDRPEATPEESFEEVGLVDEVKPKKRGLFSRFGESAETNANASSDGRPPSSHHGFHFGGRKRAQSGQGAELRSMARPASSHATEVAVEAR